MFTKFASYEVSEILDLKGSPTRQHSASLDKISDFESYRTEDGYLYARIRAISSRTNKNHDGWPSVELAGSREIFDRHHSGSGFTISASEGNPEYGFATFIGKPIFVDHHNSNPKKARGVIVDAKLNVLDRKTAAIHDSYWGSSDVDHEHMPPTEVELLLEVDAKSFPRLAKAIVSGDLDGFSMGCDVDYSKCSHCGHEATNPEEYCSHILMKGAHHDYKTADGKRVARKSYENCYGIRFFEISAVFEPADETALAREIRAAVHREGAMMDYDPATGEMVPTNDLRDPVRDDGRVVDRALGIPQGPFLNGEDALGLAAGYDNRVLRDTVHGEGTGFVPGVKNYLPRGGQEGNVDNVGMPIGPGGQHSPSPQRQFENAPGATDKSFFDAAQEALNVHPRRPVQNDPRWSSRTAENELPQEMHTRAPDEIDTMRKEQVCPICGNDMEAETCQVCGYVQPPKEFDNPDLDKAKEIRQEMKDSEEQQSTQPQTAPQPGAPQQGGPNPTAQAPGANASKAPATAKVKSEMLNWTPKVHPKTAARINQVERPVSASNNPASNEPRHETVIKDQIKPVTAAMQTAQDLMNNAKRNHMQTRTADGPTPPGDTSPHKRVDVTGVGGVDVATNEEASKSHDDQNGKPNGSGFKQVDVTAIGGTGVENVAADSEESLPTAGRESDDSGFNTDKTTEDSGPTKTFGDSDGSASGVGDPVTDKTPYWTEESDWDKASYSHRRAYEDGTLEQQDQQGDPVAQGGTAVKGVQPIAEQFGDRVNLLEHKTSPSNNSGPTTTWTGTDGNGVLKQQEPVTQESQEWGGVKVPDVKLHTTGKVSIAALRLAEAEVELGLVPREDKWNRMVEHDAKAPEVLAAELQTLSRVKTAGLAKLTQHRQASRVPSFKRIATGAETVERQPLDNEVLDSGLFLR